MDKENIKRGTFLKELRTANLLTEKDLADELGVDPADITVWETGIKFPEDSQTLETLAKILNVTKKELIHGEFKKNKDDNIIEVKYDENKKKANTKEKETLVLSNNVKNVLLVVLSGIVLIILVGTVISMNKGTATKVYEPKEKIEVSDEREPIEHHPHTSNEYMIYNTQVFSANDASNYDGSKLLDYGFKKINNKYVKATSKYKIEYYNSTFYLSIYNGSGTLYVTRDARQSLLNYKDSNRAKTVSVEMNSPSGKLNCDEDICIYNHDYYRYLNFLVFIVRG